MSATTVYLYSTLGCHLCEQAKVVLWPVLTQYQFRLQEIDIAADDALIELYGVRIPVLVVTNHNHSAELNWPFDSQQVAAFLAEAASV